MVEFSLREKENSTVLHVGGVLIHPSQTTERIRTYVINHLLNPQMGCHSFKAIDSVLRVNNRYRCYVYKLHSTSNGTASGVSVLSDVDYVCEEFRLYFRLNIVLPVVIKLIIDPNA